MGPSASNYTMLIVGTKKHLAISWTVLPPILFSEWFRVHVFKSWSYPLFCLRYFSWRRRGRPVAIYTTTTPLLLTYCLRESL